MNAHKLRDRIFVFLSKYKTTSAFSFTDEELAIEAGRDKENNKDLELKKSVSEILPEDKDVLKRIEMIRNMSGENGRGDKSIS